MNHPPVFVISLDFELHWGGFEKWPLDDQSKNGKAFRRYFLNTRKVIPEILSAMEHHHVHATWASVGLLFHETKEELMRCRPSVQPTFHLKNLSAWNFIEAQGIGNHEADDPFHFAPSLIRLIAQTPGMEVGSQTHTHFYACEPGQTREQFQADLQSACAVAALRGVELKSLIFPRNQINPAYLSTCYEAGIRAVRVNPADWYWEIPPNEKTSLWKKLNRTADAYFSIGKPKPYSISSITRREGEPYLIPASRFLRPYQNGQPLLNEVRMRRILEEMEQAARKEHVYHLWWHPHNFGSYPMQSMAGLTRILDHFRKLQRDYGMISANMAELTDLVDQSVVAK